MVGVQEVDRVGMVHVVGIPAARLCAYQRSRQAGEHGGGRISGQRGKLSVVERWSVVYEPY